MNRLRAGYCHVINPFGGQVYHVSLRPQDCLALVFWTRHPIPLLTYLDELNDRGYRYYFLYSILGYPRFLESCNPPLETSIDTFKKLSIRLSSRFIRWRYDPIVLSSETPPEYHLKQFQRIAQQLQGYTHYCIFSFVDLYGKTARNLDRVSRETGVKFYTPSVSEQRALVCELVEIAASYGMTLSSCCSDALIVNGVRKGSCVDPELIHELVPDLNRYLKKKPTRKNCGCVASIDIGAYDSCLFGCAYCYATNSRQAAQNRYSAHNPSDTVLWRPRTLENTNLDDLAVLLKG